MSVISPIAKELDDCNEAQQHKNVASMLNWDAFYPRLKEALRQCLRHYSVPKEDMEDIVNESISALYESILANKLPEYIKTEKEIVSYACGTAKHKILKFIEQYQKRQSIDASPIINQRVECSKAEESSPFIQEMEKISHINFDNRKRAIVMIYAIVYNETHPLYEQLTEGIKNKNDIALFVEYYSLESERRYETIAQRRAGRVLTDEELTRECNLIRSQVSRLVKKLTTQLCLMQKKFEHNNKGASSLYQRVYSYLTNRI